MIRKISKKEKSRKKNSITKSKNKIMVPKSKRRIKGHRNSIPNKKILGGAGTVPNIFINGIPGIPDENVLSSIIANHCKDKNDESSEKFVYGDDKSRSERFAYEDDNMCPRIQPLLTPPRSDNKQSSVQDESHIKEIQELINKIDPQKQFKEFLDNIKSRDNITPPDIKTLVENENASEISEKNEIKKLINTIFGNDENIQSDDILYTELIGISIDDFNNMIGTMIDKNSFIKEDNLATKGGAGEPDGAVAEEDKAVTDVEEKTLKRLAESGDINKIGPKKQKTIDEFNVLVTKLDVKTCSKRIAEAELDLFRIGKKMKISEANPICLLENLTERNEVTFKRRILYERLKTLKKDDLTNYTENKNKINMIVNEINENVTETNMAKEEIKGIDGEMISNIENEIFTQDKGGNPPGVETILKLIKAREERYNILIKTISLKESRETVSKVVKDLPGKTINLASIIVDYFNKKIIKDGVYQTEKTLKAFIDLFKDFGNNILYPLFGPILVITKEWFERILPNLLNLLLGVCLLAYFGTSPQDVLVQTSEKLNDIGHTVKLYTYAAGAATITIKAIPYVSTINTILSGIFLVGGNIVSKFRNRSSGTATMGEYTTLGDGNDETT